MHGEERQPRVLQERPDQDYWVGGDRQPIQCQVLHRLLETGRQGTSYSLKQVVLRETDDIYRESVVAGHATLRRATPRHTTPRHEPGLL